MVVPQWVSRFDSMIGDPVHAMRTPLLTKFFYLCTLMANTGTIVFLTVAAVIVLAVRRKFAEALLVAVVVGVGQALGTTLKLLVERQRPPVAEALIVPPGNYSLPSGHALAAMLLYGVLAFLLVRALHSRAARIAVTAASVALIALVGLSRVYLGVHWPSDVVAAWILGGAWLALCASAYLWWDRRRGAGATAAR